MTHSEDLVLQGTGQEYKGFPIKNLLPQGVSDDKTLLYISQEYGSSEKGRTQNPMNF